MKRTIILISLALCCLCSCQKLSENPSPRNGFYLSKLSNDLVQAAFDIPVTVIHKALTGKDSAMFNTPGNVIPVAYGNYLGTEYLSVQCMIPDVWRVTSDQNAPFDVFGNVTIADVITLESVDSLMHYNCSIYAEMDDRNGYTAKLSGTLDGLNVAFNNDFDCISSAEGNLFFHTLYKDELLDDATVVFSGKSRKYIFTTLK